MSGGGSRRGSLESSALTGSPMWRSGAAVCGWPRRRVRSAMPRGGCGGHQTLLPWCPRWFNATWRRSTILCVSCARARDAVVHSFELRSDLFWAEPGLAPNPSCCDCLREPAYGTCMPTRPSWTHAAGSWRCATSGSTTSGWRSRSTASSTTPVMRVSSPPFAATRGTHERASWWYQCCRRNCAHTRRRCCATSCERVTPPPPARDPRCTSITKRVHLPDVKAGVGGPEHVLCVLRAHSSVIRGQSSLEVEALRPWLMRSMTPPSARVVVSPTARFSATSRSSRRMILPLRVLGSSATTRI